MSPRERPHRDPGWGNVCLESAAVSFILASEVLLVLRIGSVLFSMLYAASEAFFMLYIAF